MKFTATEFASIALEMSGVQPDDLSLDIASKFLAALPKVVTLPKLATDEDGDVLLIWGDEGDVIVTVEKNTLHLLKEVKGANSIRIDDLQYQGGEIPVEALQHIPKEE